MKHPNAADFVRRIRFIARFTTTAAFIRMLHGVQGRKLDSYNLSAHDPLACFWKPCWIRPGEE
ncbi:hypothetical protein AWB64_01977 [Caballeronia sordidicola]|uniref:Uncharacterized protein n=1 Tax=Caballeronia sordidicola TaxID=196367 RepID=A0A158FZ17_CABSO|nr:hypothetical protein [Caballeronia sordidicola]SAL24877.1 hypothetical protein AWB64_01977 [Caballeronia sordidicola]